MQLAQRPADEHMADALPGGVEARRDVQVHRHRLALRVAQVDLDRAAAARRGWPAPARMRCALASSASSSSSGVPRSAASLRPTSSHSAALVSSMRPALVAGDQHVAHRGQQAEDELLRLLELRVLLLQRDLVLHELRVDLVHLLRSRRARRRRPRPRAGRGACAARRGRGGVAWHGGVRQCTVQTMHGSNERTMCCTATGVSSPSRTGAPTSAASSAPGVPAASRGEKFQLVGATIW